MDAPKSAAKMYEIAGRAIANRNFTFSFAFLGEGSLIAA
jgi:hypothetical protein